MLAKSYIKKKIKKNKKNIQKIIFTLNATKLPRYTGMASLELCIVLNWIVYCDVPGPDT